MAATTTSSMSTNEISMRPEGIEEFPIDFFMLNLEDYTDVFCARTGENQNGSVHPMTFTDSLAPSEDELMIDNSLASDLEAKLFASFSSRITGPISPVLTPPVTIPSPLHSPKEVSSPIAIKTNSFKDDALGAGSITPGRVTPLPSTPNVTPQSSNPSSPRGSYSNRRSSQVDSQGNKIKIPRHKRESHIKAEHKRRNKIQNGFEEIQQLVPGVRDVMSSGTKESKSGMLNKTVDYCRQLRSENKELQKEANRLRQEVAALSADIGRYQEQLPAAGAEVHCQSNHVQIEKMFEDYVRARTFQNWKFWIFGMVIRPLFTTFNCMVSTSTWKSFTNGVFTWLEQHCSLVALRPVMLNTLRQLSTQSSVMTAPEKLPDEAIQAALVEPALSSQPSSSTSMDMEAIPALSTPNSSSSTSVINSC